MAANARGLVISKALSQKGYQRQKSRWNIFAAAVYPAIQYQAYCGIFAAWAIIEATGADVRKVVWMPFVPSIEAWARKNGAWKTSGQNDGDLVVFGFGKSSAQHVGFAWRDERSSAYRSIEGNTSPGNAGSQGNGGGVHVRYRSRSQIRGWVDLDKLIAAAGGTSVPTTSTNVWDNSPRIKEMSKTDVQAIQELLVGAGYSVGKSGIDGSYKADTVAAVKAAQKALKLTADGVAGPATIAALKSALKTAAPAKPNTPAFPLPAGYYYGGPKGPIQSVSGKTRNSKAPTDVVKDAKGEWYSKGLKQAQAKLGITADGRWGPQTAKTVLAFKKKHKLPQGADLGAVTWARIFSSKEG